MMDATVIFPALGILLLVGLAAAVGSAIGALIWLLIKLIKEKKGRAIPCYFIMVASLAAIAASWIMNMGWIRFLLTIFLVPFIHLALLEGLNGLALLWQGRELKAKLLSIVSCLSGLGIHLLLPDSGDDGESYFFFSLVQSDQAADIAGIFCNLLLIAHIVVLILQLISIVRSGIKRENK